MKTRQPEMKNETNMAEMIAAVRAGDRQAFAELYEMTSQEIYRTARAVLRDEEAALDVQQDTYVFAYNHLDQLSDPEKVRPWLRSIAVNRAKSILRKQSPVLFTELENDEGEGLPEQADLSPEASPELSLERKETAELVNEILAELSDGQRAAVAMYYYEQMSVGEIAEALGVAPGTVKSQLARGKKKIEEAVRALEKKGVKLYGLSPVPFLLALMKRQSFAAQQGEAVLAKTLTRTGLAAGVKSAAAAGVKATVTAAEPVAVHVGRSFFETGVGKLLVGVLAAGLIGGGVWAGAKLLDRNQPSVPKQPTETVEAILLSNNGGSTETSEDVTEPVAYVTVPAEDTTEPTEPSESTEPAEPGEQGEISGSCGENLTWRFDPENGGLTIEGSGAMDDYPDAQVAPWHALRGEIKVIGFPDEITAIGDYAFADCTAIDYIWGWGEDNKLQRIGAHAFDGCTTFSPYHHSSFDNSFATCNISEIGDYAFRGCSAKSGEMIVCPDSVTRLGEGAFSDFAGLEKLVIMNRDCAIGTALADPTVKLCGFPGSTAEQYADQNGHPFLAVADNRDAMIGQIKQDEKTQDNLISREETCLVWVRRIGDRYLGAVSHSTHVSASEEDIQRAKQTGTIVIEGKEYRYADSDEKAVELAKELKGDSSDASSMIENGWDWACDDYDEAAGWALNADSRLYKILRKGERYYFLVCDPVGVHDPLVQEYTDMGWIWLDDDTPVFGNASGMDELPPWPRDCILGLEENGNISVDLCSTF